jgi:CheY-like chemotaxis protein
LAKRLLIVEDAIDIQTLLRRLFEMEGYTVQCASNGQEAIEVLQQTQDLPSLILLDLMMPVMDGFEFRQKQKQVDDWSSIPTVVMTADGDAQSPRLKIEATGFLRKPVDIDTLLSTAERYCA